MASTEHKSAVHNISIHPVSGDAMATAANEVLLWEMARSKVKRRLGGTESLGVQQALYSADGTLSLVCTSTFSFFSISAFVWRDTRKREDGGATLCWVGLPLPMSLHP